MSFAILTVVSFLASQAAAHFSVEYPQWRGDSFATGASQWIYPCANVNQTSQTNRTLWPLTGGSLSLDLHHPWTYIFVNLGLGTEYPVFNISLTQQPLNETGNGTLCLPQMTLPAGISPMEGQNGSIQVVTLGETGSALYNCADITFSSKATLLSGQNCTNSPGVSMSIVSQEVNGTTTTTATAPAKTSGAANIYMKATSMTAWAMVIGVSTLLCILSLA